MWPGLIPIERAGLDDPDRVVGGLEPVAQRIRWTSRRARILDGLAALEGVCGGAVGRGDRALWMGETGASRGVNLQALYAWLVAEHGYAGSYKAIRRFVRARYPEAEAAGSGGAWRRRPTGPRCRA